MQFRIELLHEERWAMKSACFTGHRALKGDLKILSERLYGYIEKCITDLNLTDFYAGGSTGFDTLAAQTVLRLREIYPQIKLHLILPCSNEEQTAGWSVELRREFYRILALADDAEYSSEHYFNGCMKARNARLVELATVCCISYWNVNDFRSGTGQTVRMAQNKGLRVMNLYDMLLDGDT